MKLKKYLLSHLAVIHTVVCGVKRIGAILYLKRKKEKETRKTYI